MVDQRSAARLRAFLKGKAIFNNRQSTLDCLVRDLSTTGARLQASSAVLLPERFDLYIAQKDTTHRVRIEWRDGDEIGVSFEVPLVDGTPTATSVAAPAATPAIAPEHPDLELRVRQLEAEASLARLLLVQLRAEIDALKAADPTPALPSGLARLGRR